MFRVAFQHLPLAALLWTATLLSGCGTGPIESASQPGSTAISGILRGGQQPVSGATVQLYQAGAAGDGSAATPLFANPPISNQNGNFNFPAGFTCPDSAALVYMVGSGGSPATGINNPQLALMDAIGPCSNITSTSFFSVNEVTTTAAVYALAPYMSSYAAVGSSQTDAGSLTTAFNLAGEYANIANGSTPGTNVPSGYTVPSAQINTVANIVATCINSGGGAIGDNSSCGTFFSLTQPTGASTAPTDAIGGLLNLANNPALNTAQLYDLAVPASPFQPSDTTQPATLGIALSPVSVLSLTPVNGLPFPAQMLNVGMLQTATLTNNSAASVSISSISYTGANASMFSTNSTHCSSPLAASASCTISVEFVPSAPGTMTATLSVANSAGPPVTIPLSGIGETTTISVSPTSVTFAGDVVGQPSTAASITYTNTGQSAGNIGPSTLTGTNPSQFSQTSTCTGIIQPGRYCTVVVSFTPNAPGTFSAALNVPVQGITVPSVPLSGAGVTAGSGILSLSATQLYVPYLPVTNSGTPAYLDATNTGSVTVNISAITITPSTAPPYTYYVETDTCVGALAPGATCVIQVTSGNSSLTTGTLAVYSDAAASPQTVALATGTSVKPFGNVAVGSTSASASFSATGTGSFWSETGAIAGTNASDFSFVNGVNTCGATLSGGTCSISVQFTPSGSGYRYANLTLTDKNASGTTAYLLEGFGVPAGSSDAVTATPTTLSFPLTALNMTTASQTMTIANPAGHILNFGFVGNLSDAPQFRVSPGYCAATSCPLTIAFLPTYVGQASDENYNSLLLIDSVSNATTTAYLHGTGGIFTASASPTELDFGTLVPGKTSSSGQSFTVSVGGDAQPAYLKLNVAGPTGASASGSGDFKNNGTPLPSSLYTGSTATVGPFYFTPSATGSRNATATISDSRTGTTLATVLLTGAGSTSAAGPVSGIPTQLSFSTFNTQTFTVHNYGSSAVAVTASISGPFTQTNSCTPSIPATSTCTVNISPTFPVGGVVSGSFTLANADISNNQTTSLTAAEGPIYSFGGVPLGGTSQNQLVLSSAQSGAYSNYSVATSFNGPDAGDFVLSPGQSCSATTSCTVTATFVPLQTGLRYVQLTSNAPSGTGPTYNTILYGIGTPSPGASAAFLIGSSNATLTEHTAAPNSISLTLVNDGTTVLSIPGISAFTSTSSQGATAVPASTTCPTSLIPGAQCSIAITYTEPNQTLYDTIHIVFTDATSGSAFDTFLYAATVSP